MRRILTLGALGLLFAGCAPRGVSVNGVEIREGPQRRPLEPQALARRSAAAVGVLTTDVGRGMAFVVDPEGYLISNRHVIEDADHIEELVFPALDPPLRFSNVRVVYIDAERDLALLKVESDRHLPYLPLATRENRVTSGYVGDADDIMLLSRRVAELGEDEGQTNGLIAHRGQVQDLEVYNPAVGPGPYLGLSPVVRQGQSGGPVVDQFGRAVGVVTWMWKDRPGGFAIPIAHANEMLESRPTLASSEDHGQRIEERALAFLEAMRAGDFEVARRVSSPSHARQVRGHTVSLLLDSVPRELVTAYIDALEELVQTSAEAGGDPFEDLRSVISRAGTRELSDVLGVDRKLSPQQVMTFFFEFGQAFIAARVFGELEVGGAAEVAIRRLHSLDAARSFALAEVVERFRGRGLIIERIDLSPGEYAPKAVVTVRSSGPGAGVTVRSKPPVNAPSPTSERFALQMRLEWGDWYVAEVQDRGGGAQPDSIELKDGLSRRAATGTPTRSR